MGPLFYWYAYVLLIPKLSFEATHFILPFEKLLKCAKNVTKTNFSLPLKASDK